MHSPSFRSIWRARATRIAVLLGKYSYSVPIPTPARSAILLVLKAALPFECKICDAASRIAATVAWDRDCVGLRRRWTGLLFVRLAIEPPKGVGCWACLMLRGMIAA